MEKTLHEHYLYDNTLLHIEAKVNVHTVEIIHLLLIIQPHATLDLLSIMDWNSSFICVFYKQYATEMHDYCSMNPGLSTAVISPVRSKQSQEFWYAGEFQAMLGCEDRRDTDATHPPTEASFMSEF